MGRGPDCCYPIEEGKGFACRICPAYLAVENPNNCGGFSYGSGGDNPPSYEYAILVTVNCDPLLVNCGDLSGTVSFSQSVDAYYDIAMRTGTDDDIQDALESARERCRNRETNATYKGQDDRFYETPLNAPIELESWCGELPKQGCSGACVTGIECFSDPSSPFTPDFGYQVTIETASDCKAFNGQFFGCGTSPSNSDIGTCVPFYDPSASVYPAGETGGGTRVTSSTLVVTGPNIANIIASDYINNNTSSYYDPTEFMERNLGDNEFCVDSSNSSWQARRSYNNQKHRYTSRSYNKYQSSTARWGPNSQKWSDLSEAQGGPAGCGEYCNHGNPGESVHYTSPDRGTVWYMNPDNVKSLGVGLLNPINVGNGLAEFINASMYGALCGTHRCTEEDQFKANINFNSSPATLKPLSDLANVYKHIGGTSSAINIAEYVTNRNQSYGSVKYPSGPSTYNVMAINQANPHPSHDGAGDPVFHWGGTTSDRREYRSVAFGVEANIRVWRTQIGGPVGSYVYRSNGGRSNNYVDQSIFGEVDTWGAIFPSAAAYINYYENLTEDPCEISYGQTEDDKTRRYFDRSLFGYYDSLPEVPDHGATDEETFWDYARHGFSNLGSSSFYAPYTYYGLCYLSAKGTKNIQLNDYPDYYNGKYVPFTVSGRTHTETTPYDPPGECDFICDPASNMRVTFVGRGENINHEGAVKCDENGDCSPTALSNYYGTEHDTDARNYSILVRSKGSGSVVTKKLICTQTKLGMYQLPMLGDPITNVCNPSPDRAVPGPGADPNGPQPEPYCVNSSNAIITRSTSIENVEYTKPKCYKCDRIPISSHNYYTGSSAAVTAITSELYGQPEGYAGGWSGVLVETSQAGFAKKVTNTSYITMTYDSNYTRCNYLSCIWPEGDGLTDNLYSRGCAYPSPVEAPDCGPTGNQSQPCALISGNSGLGGEPSSESLTEDSLTTIKTGIQYESCQTGLGVEGFYSCPSRDDPPVCNTAYNFSVWGRLRPCGCTYGRTYCAAGCDICWTNTINGEDTGMKDSRGCPLWQTKSDCAPLVDRLTAEYGLERKPDGLCYDGRGDGDNAQCFCERINCEAQAYGCTNTTKHEGCSQSGPCCDEGNTVIPTEVMSFKTADGRAIAGAGWASKDAQCQGDAGNRLPYQDSGSIVGNTKTETFDLESGAAITGSRSSKIAMSVQKVWRATGGGGETEFDIRYRPSSALSEKSITWATFPGAPSTSVGLNADGQVVSGGSGGDISRGWFRSSWSPTLRLGKAVFAYQFTDKVMYWAMAYVSGATSYAFAEVGESDAILGDKQCANEYTCKWLPGGYNVGCLSDEDKRIKWSTTPSTTQPYMNPVGYNQDSGFGKTTGASGGKPYWLDGQTIRSGSQYFRVHALYEAMADASPETFSGETQGEALQEVSCGNSLRMMPGDSYTDYSIFVRRGRIPCSSFAPDGHGFGIGSGFIGGGTIGGEETFSYASERRGIIYGNETECEESTSAGCFPCQQFGEWEAEHPLNSYSGNGNDKMPTPHDGGIAKVGFRSAGDSYLPTVSFIRVDSDEDGPTYRCFQGDEGYVERPL